MKEKRKRISVLIAFTAVIILTAGCKKTGGFTPKLSKESDCEIRMVGSYKNFESIEEEFKRFRVYYPNVDISYTYIDDYKNIIQTVLVSEDAPELYFEYEDMQISPLALSDEKNSLDLSAIRENLIYYNENNEVTMIPMFANTYGMMVNENIFNNLGLSVPTTFTDFMNCCKQFSQAGFSSPLMAYYDWTLYMNFTTAVIGSAIAADVQNAEKINSLNLEGGNSIRPYLKNLKELSESKMIDINSCRNEIKDNYNSVIMRFFEGDVPFMLASAETVSGTAKREERSESFSKNPFVYSFHPFPVSDGKLSYYDAPYLGELAVNGKSENVEMALEFMRFLCSAEELNVLAKNKGSFSVTKQIDFDSKYKSFSKMNAENVFSERQSQISEEAYQEVRAAIILVFEGIMNVEEVCEKFGSLQQYLNLCETLGLIS